MSTESYPDFSNNAYAELAASYRRLTLTDFRRAVGAGVCTAITGGAALLAPLAEQDRQGFVMAAALGSVAIICARTTRDLVQIYKTDGETTEFYEKMAQAGQAEA